jgi:hypothetical protein
MVKGGKFPDDFRAIRKALLDVQKSLTMSAHYTRTEDRIRNVGIITGLIQGQFVKKEEPVIGGAHALVVEVENSLRRSRFEASRYEFKIGCCALSEPPVLDQNMYSKLARTAAAIANASPEADGFIYLGVADKKAAADRVNEMFGSAIYQIGEVYFVGISHDLSILGINLETYVKNIIKELQKTGLADPLKTQLITCIDHGEYRGAPFVRLRIPKQHDLTTFDGDYPIRKNSDTVNMTAGEAVAQSRMFRA